VDTEADLFVVGFLPYLEFERCGRPRQFEREEIQVIGRVVLGKNLAAGRIKTSDGEVVDHSQDTFADSGV